MKKNTCPSVDTNVIHYCYLSLPDSDDDLHLCLYNAEATVGRKKVIHI